MKLRRILQEVEQWQSQFDNEVRRAAGAGAVSSPSAEIERAKHLLDRGVITQAEFEAIKGNAIGMPPAWPQQHHHQQQRQQQQQPPPYQYVLLSRHTPRVLKLGVLCVVVTNCCGCDLTFVVVSDVCGWTDGRVLTAMSSLCYVLCVAHIA